MARQRFRTPRDPAARWPPPARQRTLPETSERPPSADEDPELHGVLQEILRRDPNGARFAEVIRETLDQIYDGRRTGRWDYSQLNKTEKTFVGTLIEINLQNEFEFEDGRVLDYLIGDVEVDCKFSKDLYGWMIPQEMYKNGDRIALLVWASDYESQWYSGLLRIEDRLLGTGNQDKKRTLTSEGIDRIVPLLTGDLTENTLLHLSAEARNRILANRRSGQSRVDELFRSLQGRLVDRATILAVAQQEDCAKRVRDARLNLAREGIVIFGHYEPHPEYAERLGLPRPALGQFVSARLVEADQGDSRPTIGLGGRAWRAADEHDGVRYEPVPRLPRQGRSPAV